MYLSKADETDRLTYTFSKYFLNFLFLSVTLLF